MPDPSEVGKAKIIVEADTSGVKASLRDAKNETEKLGAASDKSAAKISKNAKKSTSSINAMGSSLTKVQEVFSKLIIPVALVTGITTLIKKITEVREEAAKFRKELQAVSDISYDKLRGILVSEQFDELGQSIAALEEQRRAEVNKTLEAFEAKSQSTINALRSGVKDLIGLDLGFDREEAAAATEAAIERINSNYASLIEKQKKAFKEQEQEQDRLAAIEAQKVADAEAEKTAALQKRLQIEAQAAAQRNADMILAAEQAAEAFAEKFDQVIGADFTTRLDSIAAALTRGNNAIGRLK
jgi:hypothetical protein